MRIHQMVSRFGRDVGARTAQRDRVLAGGGSLGEIPKLPGTNSAIRDPLVICITHGGKITEQVVGQDGTYTVRCTDGYVCSYGAGGTLDCEQGSPSAPPLFAGQVYPPPDAAAVSSCASHGGVYKQWDDDQFTRHWTCVDGETCDFGASELYPNGPVCKTGTPPSPPLSQAGCGMAYQFDAGDGDGCRCMPGTISIPAPGNVTICMPSLGAGGGAAAPPASGPAKASFTPGGYCSPDGRSDGVYDAAGNCVQGAAIDDPCTLPGGAPGRYNGSYVCVGADGKPGGSKNQQGSGSQSGSGTDTAPKSTFRKALPYVAAGVGVVVLGVGGKVAYDKIKKK